MPETCSLSITREPGTFTIVHSGYAADYVAARAAAAVLETLAEGSDDLPPDADGSGDPAPPPPEP
jgi:hydrogenase maturation factor